MSDGGVDKQIGRKDSIADVIQYSEMSCGQGSGKLDIN